MNDFNELLARLGAVGIGIIVVVVVGIVLAIVAQLTDGEHYNGEIDFEALKKWFKWRRK